MEYTERFYKELVQKEQDPVLTLREERASLPGSARTESMRSLTEDAGSEEPEQTA